MTRTKGRSRRISTIFVTALCAGLAGCEQYWRESGVWDIGEHQGLLLDVRNYYQRHGAEEGGRCHSPILEGVSRAEVFELDDEVLEVHLHYRYRDFLNDGDDDCDPKFRPLRCTILRECRGFAARSFRVVETETGFDVIDMSGYRQR